jgi:hypothetical protein
MRNDGPLLCVACVLLIGCGYELNSWLRPTNARAQEPVTVTAANRFQVLELKAHGDILVDSANGRVFDFTSGGPNGGQILQEVPVRSCADAECTAWKRVADAGQ